MRHSANAILMPHHITVRGAPLCSRPYIIERVLTETGQAVACEHETKNAADEHARIVRRLYPGQRGIATVVAAACPCHSNHRLTA